MPEFATRDPRTAAFWDERFERGFTPWERGGVPDALRAFATAAARPLRTLIPGCGSAHELVFLSELGWDATAIDFSPAAVETARANAGRWSARVAEADIFAWEPPAPLDLVYERAFLCALPPALREQLAARWAALLQPGALVAGYFYFDDSPKGPPFGIARDALSALMRERFACVVDEPVTDSIPIFQGKERWMVWRRR